MNREFLKGLGLDDAAVDKAMAEHGKALNTVKDKADKVDGLESQITDLQGQIKDRDTQLEGLSDKAKDSEELTAEIERLKGENATATTEMQEKLDKQSFDFSLEKALTNAKVRNPKALKALLDSETLKLDGDTILGLDAQLTAIKETDPYLFEVEEVPPNSPAIVAGGNPKGDVNPFSKDSFSLTEQTRLFREDPARYEQYKAHAK